MSELFDKAGGDWRKHWDEVEAAQGYEALPGAVYEAEPSRIEFHRAKSGTEGIKITWLVMAGEYEGRRVWQDLWLSEKALPFTKRVLAELSMSSPDDPLPDVVCAIQVAKRQNDQGIEFNEVRKVKFLRTNMNPCPVEAAAATTSTPTTISEAGDQEAPQPASEEEDGTKPSVAAPSAAEAQQPVVVELDTNIGSMINAAAVRRVSGGIPIDGPTDLDELGGAFKDMTSNTIMLALEVLRRHGLNSKFHRGTTVYWWAGDRPELDIKDTVRVEKPLAADEKFIADLRAVRAEKGGAARV